MYITYTGKNKKFADLPEWEKANINQVLQALGCSCVSDAAYHGLAMVFPDPKPSKPCVVQQSRADVNKITTLEIINSPGERDQISFLGALVAEFFSLKDPTRQLGRTKSK